MHKIRMTTPLVEMQGDEMTRVLWDWIKELLIEPYVQLKTDFYDLGLPNREATADRVTHEAAAAIKEYGVGVKCATITPNAQRVEEYKLSHMWLSPNGTIRAALDGTVFRAPILVKGITPYIPTWTKPITIARHAYGDVYRNAELKVDGGARAELTVTYPDGRTDTRTIAEFKGTGIVQGIHNTDASITSFARSCFNYALDTRRTCGLPPRTPSARRTITGSRTSSARFSTPSTRRGLPNTACITNTRSSTTRSRG